MIALWVVEFVPGPAALVPPRRDSAALIDRGRTGSVFHWTLAAWYLVDVWPSSLTPWWKASR